MAYIKDSVFNYSSSTANLWGEVPAPVLAAGDLLVCVPSTDTGTQSYFCGDKAKYVIGATATPAYTNYSTAANNDTASDVNVLSATPALNAACYYGADTPFAAISLFFGTAGSAVTLTMTYEYWNGSAWTALSGVTDGTTNFTVTTVTIGQTIRWTNIPGDWATTSVNGTTAYWVRGIISAFTSVTTAPLATRVIINDWQQLLSTTNTSNHGVLWKVATSADEAVSTYRISYTTAETSNFWIAAVTSTNTQVPFSTTVATNNSYSETNANTYYSLYNGSTTRVGQSYLAVAAIIGSAKFYLKKFGSPTGTCVARLYAHSGTFGTSSVATGVPLATSYTLDVSTLTTTAALYEFGFPYRYNTTATNFVIAIEYSGGDASNYLQVGYDSSSPTHGGNATTYNGTWSAVSTADLTFYVNNFTFATSTWSTAKANLPTMTTSVDNTFLLYAVTTSGVGVPSILEGPVTSVVAKDGTAHADGIGWSIQGPAGITGTVGASVMTASAGTMSVCGINPATSNDNVPGYVQADNSIYVSPFTGAAFNSDAVPANTITTQYTTAKINGTTLTNAINTYTIADYGINTYHAMSKLTGVATNNTWAGWSTSIVARTNLASKNIIFHISPQTPIAIQTTDSVSNTGACGIAIGLGTSAGNFKFWHVHGSGTAWQASSWVPAVINTDNTTGVIESGGTLNTASIARIAMAVSAKVVAPTWLMCSIWALDTTVVCGGSAIGAIGIRDIVSALATGKERRSAIIQGKNQMLVLQPVQFGNGGTNSTYLDLNTTAIEFPQLYNKDAKAVNYCSVENFSGITYYAGASDTIKHRNSVISSPSKYHWKFHASSSGSATYDFNGLSVIGAGTVTLHASVNLTGVTWNNCDQITAVGNTLTNCIFNASQATASQGAFYITGSTQTALQTALDKLVNCTFSNNTVPAGALRIEYTGAASSITLNISSGTFSGNTADIRWEAVASSPLTINVSGTANPTTYSATNSNTVTFVTGIRTVTLTVTDINGTIVSGANVLVKASSGTYFPYGVTVTISNSGTTATVTHTSHNMATGDKVVIKGASLQANNGVFTITKINDNSYSYTMGSTPGSSPTGTITSTFVFLNGTTNGSGQIALSRQIPSNHGVTGWARKSSGAPYYKPGGITGTVSGSADTNLSAILLSD